MKALIYLLQVSACTGIFYSFYFLFLRRYTFFTINRWYLLVTLLLSFVIPALNIKVDNVPTSPVLQPVIYAQQIQTLPDPSFVVTMPNGVKRPAFTWLSILQRLYIGIAAISTLQLIFILATFIVRSRRKALMQIGKVKILKGGKKLGNSSFLNVIFINDEELEPHEVNQIIAHEMLHINLYHSADRMLARIIQVMLWFNPFIYLYIRSIEENHEFEVDRIIANQSDKGLYATLLFKLAVSGRSYLFHSFSKVPLKKRIAMIFNQPTSNMKKIVYLLILPMVIVSCLAFARLKTEHKPSALGDLSTLGPNPKVIIDGKDYPVDILYKISNSCIARSSMMGMTFIDGKPRKNLKNKNPDGLVEITTKEHKITYLTKIETENLAAEASVAKNVFYSRIKLKNADGSEYNKGIVQIPGKGGMTISFSPGDKVVFLIDGKAFPEAKANQVEAYVKNHKITAEYGTGPVSANDALTKPYVDKYQIYFSFTIDTAKATPKTGSNVKPKSTFQKAAATYANTAEGKKKSEIAYAIKGKTLTYKVTAFVNADKATKVNEHFTLINNGNEVVLFTGWDQLRELKKSINVGDEIEMTVFECASSINGGPLSVMPSLITKSNKTLFKLSKANIIASQNASSYKYQLNSLNNTPVICIKTTPDVVPTGKLFADNPMLYTTALCKKASTTIAN